MKEFRLKELFSLKHGYAFKSEFFADDGDFVVTTPGHFSEAGGFRFRDGKEKFYKGDFNPQFLLNKDDLIIAMTEQGEGLLGSTALIPEAGKYLHNQRLGLVYNINSNEADKWFLYYLLNSQSIRTQVAASSSGTKVRHTSPERIGNCKTLLPPVPIQTKIASILSAYDELIENNKQRIKLLEEMAEEIYKEWFVRFRFPGYESTTFFNEQGKEVPHGTVGALPEGWDNGSIGKLYNVKSGFAFKSEELGR